MGLESIADYNPNPEGNPLGSKRFITDPRYKGSWWKEFGVDDATAMRMNIGAANESGLGAIAEPGTEVVNIESMRRAQDPTRTARVMREQNLNQSEEWARGVELNLPRARVGLQQLPTRGPGSDVPIGFEGANLSLEGKSLGRQVPSKYLTPETSSGRQISLPSQTPTVQAQPPGITTMSPPRVPGREEIQRTLSTFGSDAYKRGQYLRTLPGESLTPELAREKFTADNGGTPESFDESRTYYGSAAQFKGLYDKGYKTGSGNLNVTESSGVKWSPEQNRYYYVGPHATGLEFEAVKKTPLQQGLTRLGGGIIGGGLGLMTGGALGMGMGTYLGAGGPVPGGKYGGAVLGYLTGGPLGALAGYFGGQGQPETKLKDMRWGTGGPPSGTEMGLQIGLAALYNKGGKKYPGRMSY